MKTVQKIAQALDETEPDALATISRVIKVVGEEKALAILEETLKIEAEGGMLTDDGSRRRSAGGVFFKLVKNRTTSRERGSIFGPGRTGKPQAQAKPLSWEVIKQLSNQALTSKGRATAIPALVESPPSVPPAGGEAGLFSPRRGELVGGKPVIPGIAGDPSLF